ncbi:hypothetical protein LA080_002560 [Diaporthe eres]|nr:hypothetical protein LA080_002560 [Diaporthe eres]
MRLTELSITDNDELMPFGTISKSQNNKTHARLRAARIRHDGAKTLTSRPVTKPAKLRLIFTRLLLKMVQDRLDERERPTKAKTITAASREKCMSWVPSESRALCNHAKQGFSFAREINRHGAKGAQASTAELSDSRNSRERPSEGWWFLAVFLLSASVGDGQ